LTKTLYLYLSRDLGRVAALALVAFTLILTVFAIIEPLRREGLATEQVLALIAYTVPVMISLTLPIAALLAATIVYGRFSQDNELMACTASGVSTLSLLRPALVLGGIVTVITLLLNNFIAPKMAEMAETAVKANIKNIAYNQLRSKGYLKTRRYIIHADYADPDANIMYGVVAADIHKPHRVQVFAFRQASVFFNRYGKETYLLADPVVDPVGPLSNEGGKLQVYSSEARVPLDDPLPNPIRDEPAWYDWKQLLETLADPSRNYAINEEVKSIQRAICFDRMYREIASTVEVGKPYTRLVNKQGEMFEIRAPKASVTDTEVDLQSDTAGGRRRPVVMTVRRGQEVIETSTADECLVRASYYRRVFSVEIELTGHVMQRIGGDATSAPQQKTKLYPVRVELPKDLMSSAQKITLEEMCNRPESVTPSKSIQKRIDTLRRHKIRKLIGKIKAEMHSRIGYGLSCFLLVAMGAALGLLFRGGQIISAFAISVAPAAVVIVMVIMGKEMIRNPEVPMAAGLACIWSGIALLLVGDVVVYMRLMRK